jgi:hypothetical protein
LACRAPRPECCLNRFSSLVAFPSCAPKTLSSVVAIPCRCLREFEVGPEQRAPQLVSEGAVSSGQLSHEGIAHDEGSLGRVKRIQTIVRKTRGVQGGGMRHRACGTRARQRARWRLGARERGAGNEP